MLVVYYTAPTKIPILFRELCCWSMLLTWYTMFIALWRWSMLLTWYIMFIVLWRWSMLLTCYTVFVRILMCSVHYSAEICYWLGTLCLLHYGAEVCYWLGILRWSKYWCVHCTITLKYATDLIYCVGQNTDMFSAQLRWSMLLTWYNASVKILMFYVHYIPPVWYWFGLLQESKYCTL
jgi:hypothetical protein